MPSVVRTAACTLLVAAGRSVVGLPVQPQEVAASLWKPARLDAIRDAWARGEAADDVSHAIKEVIQQADAEVRHTGFYSITHQDMGWIAHYSLMDQHDPHDYLSMGVYLFPCNKVPSACDKPRFFRAPEQYQNSSTAAGSSSTPCMMETGLPWVSCDASGVKNMNVYRAEQGEAVVRKMSAGVSNLVLAWHYTGNEVYAGKAAHLLEKFFIDSETAMSPNFKYAQHWPGEEDGMPSGAVEAYRLLDILDAASLLQRAPDSIWSDAQHSALLSWYSQFSAWYRSSDVGHRAEAAPNNVALWYDAFMMGAAMHLGSDFGHIASSIKGALESQITPDGELPRETERPNSRAYVTYTLTAIARCCRMVKTAIGEDLWSNEKVSKVFQKYIPYVNGALSWPHPDTEKGFEWTWAGEFTRLAARAYQSMPYEEVCHKTKGSHLRLYGAPLGAVYPHLEQPLPDGGL